ARYHRRRRRRTHTGQYRKTAQRSPTRVSTIIAGVELGNVTPSSRLFPPERSFTAQLWLLESGFAHPQLKVAWKWRRQPQRLPCQHCR
ncbi:hypothetical protein UPYG_G00083510, partial [Umbra pygmaea]